MLAFPIMERIEMTISNKERVGRVLDAVKDGLAPYVVREYRMVYKKEVVRLIV